MTKEQMIERYRDGYATDAHLDTAVEMEILTSEEAEVLKAERKDAGGIVKREEVEAMKQEITAVSLKVDEAIIDSDYRLLMLETMSMA